MRVVALPDSPEEPDDFEDFVAALFHAAGYYVETVIHERDPTDILELDVVATSYEPSQPARLLVECKARKWGFPDIFKVLGWMRYLEIGTGGFFVLQPSKRHPVDQVRSKVEPLGLQFLEVDLGALERQFEEAGFGRIRDIRLLTTYQYARRIERRYFTLVTYHCSQTDALRAMEAARAYYHVINDRVFFEPDPVAKLIALYDAFRQHPRLALCCGVEMDCGQYPAQRGQQSRSLKDALYTGRPELLDACLWIEHRARLAILKSGLDLLRAGDADLHFSTLPDSFVSGMASIAHDPYLERYPLFWQYFVLGLGGFVLNDRQAEEYELLSERAGIPTDQIPSALAAYDRLFPQNQGGSWLRQLSPHCQVLSMFPMALRGLGVHERAYRYGWSNVYEHGYSGFTGRLLDTWARAPINLLDLQ